MGLFKKGKTKGFESLDQVQSFLNCIENINCGGCGISALAMYRWLKKHNQLTTDDCFYCCEHDEENHNNNLQYYSNKEIKLKASSHVVLCHNGITIDSGGYKATNYYPYKIVEKSEAFMIAMINNVCSWNYQFGRKTNVPKIAKALDIDLSDVKLSWD